PAVPARSHREPPEARDPRDHPGLVRPVAARPPLLAPLGHAGDRGGRGAGLRPRQPGPHGCVGHTAAGAPYEGHSGPGRPRRPPGLTTLGRALPLLAASRELARTAAGT